jgi:competence protein ComEA
MNSPLMTPTFDTASQLTHAREEGHFGLAAKALAICILLLGLSPFVSWASEPVNINLASVEVLAESLKGVGLAKAHRFVEYREAHGPFEYIDELAAVQGIGFATVEKNRSVILLQ